MIPKGHFEINWPLKETLNDNSKTEPKMGPWKINIMQILMQTLKKPQN